jgi:hypothetical protein
MQGANILREAKKRIALLKDIMAIILVLLSGTYSVQLINFYKSLV